MQYGSSQYGVKEYGAGTTEGEITLHTSDIDGLAAIEVTTLKNLAGVANIIIKGMGLYSLQGKASINFHPDKTITGLSRITIVGTKIITGKTRIKSTTVKTLDGKGYVSITLKLNTLDGKSDIKKSMSEVIEGKARISLGATNFTPIVKPPDVSWQEVDKPSSGFWKEVKKPFK